MGGGDRPHLAATLFFFFLAGNLSFFSASAETDPLDLSALRALYGSLNAQPKLAGWRSEGGDPCGGESWRGVLCSGQSVVSIKINELGLSGFLGSELSTLLSLKELDVSYNSIGGEIPNGLPPNATYINLAMNNFTRNIPFSLSSLKFLRHLNVSHNSLSGSIGNVFKDMQNMEELDLSFNYFTGDLPSSFSSLTNLHGLFLQENQFTGSVNFLANLPLSVLYLEGNHFSGSVPKEFESIPDLRIGGNLFQLGYTFSLQIINGSAHSPVSMADRNASHSPGVSSSSFGYSSLQVTNHNWRRFSPGVLAVTISGVLLVALLAAILLVINKSHNGNLDARKGISDSLHALPKTAPIVSMLNLDQCPLESPQMARRRPLSVCHIKPERMPTRKSLSKRSRNLLAAKLYSASVLQAATNNYSEKHILGEGLMGCVYRAEFPDGQLFAVKKFDMVALTVYEEDEFLDVIWNMSRLRHPCISNLFGYCVEDGQHLLVYEYASNGSLDDVLFSTNNMCKTLSWKARMRIALGVAHALEYMHCVSSPPIAHGNIKATNILLHDELMPRIIDCGLTALNHLITMKPKIAGLPDGNGYVAPELSKPGADKTKSDVYSFGVVLLVLLTGKRAFDSSRRNEEQHLVNWASVQLHDFISLRGIVDPAIKGTISSKALSQFADIILLCIQPQPEFRLSMTEVLENLVRLVQKRDQCTPAEASELDVSDLSFKSTLAYFESQSSPLST